MYELGGELGIGGVIDPSKVMRILTVMNIEIDGNGHVYYNDMLFAILRRYYSPKYRTKRLIEQRLI